MEEGGETAFPKSRHWLDENVQATGEWSECASGSVSAKPSKGDALLFFSLDNDLNQDFFSLHTGPLALLLKPPSPLLGVSFFVLSTRATALRSCILLLKLLDKRDSEVSAASLWNPPNVSPLP